MECCSCVGKLMSSSMKRTKPSGHKLMTTGVIKPSVTEPSPEHVLLFEVWSGLLEAVCVSMTL